MQASGAQSEITKKWSNKSKSHGASYILKAYCTGSYVPIGYNAKRCKILGAKLYVGNFSRPTMNPHKHMDEGKRMFNKAVKLLRLGVTRTEGHRVERDLGYPVESPAII